MNKPPVVLVLEDDAGVRESFVEALSSNFKVIQSGHPNQAFDLLTAADCLLLDLSLPGMHGLGFLKKIRNFGHSIPVVIVTGTMASDLVWTRCGEFDIVDVIQKPVDMRTLRAKVAEAVDASRNIRFLDEATTRLRAINEKYFNANPFREILT